MREPLIYKIISPIILVVFTITSCNFFAVPEPPLLEPSIPLPDDQSGISSVPIGKGDIQIVYLDEDYQPTTNDIGKMALYVENNELTRDVMVVSEIHDNKTINDVVVRIINRQNNSLVSMFYHSYNKFPYKIAMSMDGQDITGRFSTYNQENETYSVEFSNGDGDTELFEDLILNKNVFSLHKDSDELTITQNIRLRNIITTLALWNSLAFQIDGDFTVNARGLFNWKALIVAVLVVVAVVAVVAVVVLAPPAAVAIAGAVITAAVVTTTQVVAAGIAIAAGAAALLAEILIPDDFGSEAQKTPKPPDPPKLPEPPGPPEPPPTLPPLPEYAMIEITLDGGERIENNQMPPYYLEQGKSKTFNFKIAYLPPETGVGDVIYLSSDFLYAFDPNTKTRINFSDPNARYFDVNYVTINNIVQITVSRNIRNGIDEDGRVQFIIPFRQSVIINDVSTGVNFREEPDGQETFRKDVFIFNFTVSNE